MPKTYYDSELTAEQIEDALTAIDGVVNPSNNGKVLYIENGQIKAASASRWSGGAVLEPLSVTQNGTYNPPSGIDGYAPVTVNVSGGGSVLPSGYTQKQYLEASGTQYIDTGIKAQGGFYGEVEFAFAESVTGWHGILSGDNANINKAIKLYHNGMTGGTFQYNTNFSDFTKSFVANKKYVASIGNGGMVDGEILIKWAKTSFTSNNNVALFAGITGSAQAVDYFVGKIYSCKIWLDGTLTRDFIPCIRDSDNEAGMYDLVTNTFYGNSGTGSFAYA